MKMPIPPIPPIPPQPSDATGSDGQGPWTPERILAVLLGEAVATERGAMDQAAALDPATASLVRQLSSTLDALRDATLAAPVMETTSAQRARLAALRVGTLAGWAEAARDKLREIVGVLVRDTFREPALGLGFRGAASDRVLRYEFEGGSVDLRVAPDAGRLGRFWIHGQFSGFATPTLVGAGEVEAPVEGDGYFEVEVGEGVLELRFQGDDWRVVLPAVPVSGR